MISSSSEAHSHLWRSVYSVYLLYFWGFLPFQFFIVPIYHAITKNISESTCGKSSCFTAARSNTIHLCFLNEETWNELDIHWPHDKIQDGGGYLHDLSVFYSKSFHICAKKPQDI